MNTIIEDALNIVYNFTTPLCDNKTLTKIEQGILSLAGIDKFDFSGQIMLFGSYENAQSRLARLNEHEDIRKDKGVYYTPTDVVEFIVTNAIKSSFGILTSDNIQESFSNDLDETNSLINKTIFEPTCGAGEFLLEALEQKIAVLKKSNSIISKDEIERLVRTIYGNDINNDSIVITKLRLFLCIAFRFGIDYCIDIPDILNQNFTTCDYVVSPPNNDINYDIIIGNPPYVEDNKSGLILYEHYGNIYANVLLNSALRLKDGGSMGFIIPLSYISTPRMKRIRENLMDVVDEQYILSYADRPDCLFESVHQKLCILICRKSNDSPKVFTGNYQFWYKEERNTLFDRTGVVKNDFPIKDFIPKLGSSVDVDVYKKVSQTKNRICLVEMCNDGESKTFVNMRACFWIKAFRNQHIGSEYKIFSFKNEEIANYFFCLLNSTLFWWYWICVSDCWHITNKELLGFMVPINYDFSVVTKLAQELEKKLEETKLYVGTKQTDYEYKHKLCIKEIHSIDDYINGLFGLTKDESDYIKNFAYKYRISGGV